MPVTMRDSCQGPKCENPLDGLRVDAKYCSSACKLQAYHSRKGIVTKRERDYSVCQRDGCDNGIPENSRADTKYCSNSCRQRVYNEAHKDQAKEKRDKVAAVRAKAKEKVKEKEAVEDFIKELMGE